MGERNLSGLGESLANPDHEEPEEEEEQLSDNSSPPEQEVETEATDSNTQSATAESGVDNEKVDDSSSSPEKQTAGASRCQEITRGGTQCDHEAQVGSNYCKKHQPDKFGNRPRDFQRKQWNLLPEVIKGLFEDSVTADSLYIDVQKELNMNFQKKTVENKMGEFLLEHRDEFIEFMKREYGAQE
ncbi:hypothetical protein HYG81_18990 (plasmid) [Natrinema zhouii]|uniref:hypothetical protein n=1 Tax=Natrinema zhouii TaxID=1710539 RepID=UPI001CFF74B1|nr:hypothetical protein [Natrinema zhouii]UHQ98187.1 hypothetical protein HYG81_18990 [Natrinema zhouii]